MGQHIPIVEEGWSVECIEGECDHETEADCVIPVVACAECLDRVQGEAAADDMSDGYYIPEWPCVEATHYPEPMMRDLKAALIEEWRSKR